MRQSIVSLLTSTEFTEVPEFSLYSDAVISLHRYNDFAVGAYKSNAAVLFRTRPLVRVNGVISGKGTTLRIFTTRVVWVKDWAIS